MKGGGHEKVAESMPWRGATMTAAMRTASKVTMTSEGGGNDDDSRAAAAADVMGSASANFSWPATSMDGSESGGEDGARQRQHNLHVT